MDQQTWILYSLYTNHTSKTNSIQTFKKIKRREVGKIMQEVYVTHKVYELIVEGKSYFGYTRKTLEERVRQHLRAGTETNDKKKLYNQLRKIWSHDDEYIPFARTVYESDSKVMALLHEIKFIKDNNSTITGLNVTVGGEDGDTHVKYLANERQVKDVLGMTWQQFVEYCRI